MNDIPVLNKVEIGDRSWRLRPLKGRRARFMIPKIASVVSRIIFAAIRAGVDVKEVFSFFDLEGEIAWTDLPLEELMKAIHFIIESITEDNLDFINDEALPYLLQIDLEDDDMAKWWDEEAEPFPTYQATYKAIQYHLSTSFGKATVEAIKKSTAAEEKAAADESSE